MVEQILFLMGMLIGISIWVLITSILSYVLQNSEYLRTKSKKIRAIESSTFVLCLFILLIWFIDGMISSIVIALCIMYLIVYGIRFLYELPIIVILRIRELKEELKKQD